MTPTSRQLYAYASRFASASEKAGEGTKWPTFRQAARRFRCTLDEIEEAVASYEGDGYMGAGVAMATSAGYYPLRRRGQWVIEAYGETSAATA